MRTFDLLDSPLVATTYDELIGHVQNLARRNGTQAIDFTNTHIVTLRRQDAHFREITSRFDRFVPDGMPLIWPERPPGRFCVTGFTGRLSCDVALSAVLLRGGIIY